MKTKLLIFSIVFLFIMLVLPTVESFGPHAHNKLSTDLLDEETTVIGKLCGSTEENRAAY